MSEFEPTQTSPSATPEEAKLEVLHERVNAMLETPLPKEGDAFPLPVEETIGTPPPGV